MGKGHKNFEENEWYDTNNTEDYEDEEENKVLEDEKKMETMLALYRKIMEYVEYHALPIAEYLSFEDIDAFIEQC